MSKNIFNSVQYPKVATNTFDLSHDKKMSFKMGGLYPTLVMDCLPGDRIRLNTETMLRFAPLISPVMHRVNVTSHYFFVPNRLLWSNWERWITGDLEVEPPTFSADDWGGDGIPVGSLGDYLGFPTTASMAGVKMSAFPVAAYKLIYAEYYRDQNLQTGPNEEFEPLGNGDNYIYSQFCRQPVKRRAWQHDYFTSALPFAQKGDAVTLPLVTGDGYLPVQFNDSTLQPIIRRAGIPFDELTGTLSAATGTGTAPMGALSQGSNHALIDPNGSLIVPTAGLTSEAADINTLRRAFKLQEWLERNARGGTRYIENIMAHFGVKSSDARLQRPEFLGGSYQKMVISEVLSTAETELPVGQMAGHGVSVGSGREFTYRCEEHGWIVGIINVQPVTAYQQGMPRMFSREDRLDYAWPTFAHIGEQEILNKELFISESEEWNNGTFGYTPRYAEYRYMPSTVAGEMRTTLSHWHLGRIFSSQPNLNASFITSAPSNRIFAVTDNADHIYGHVFHNLKAVRKLPRFGTPSF